MLWHGETLKTLCEGKAASRQRPHNVWFHFCEVSAVGKSPDPESGLRIAQNWEVEVRWVRRLADTVSSWRDEVLSAQTLVTGYRTLRISWAIDSYALGGWVLEYMNYIPVKMLKCQIKHTCACACTCTGTHTHSVLWYPGFDPGTEKNISGKRNETQIQSRI